MVARRRSHRLITLREAIRRADPDWDHYNLYGIEYDFNTSRPGFGRVFEAKTGARGQYAIDGSTSGPDPTPSGTLYVATDGSDANNGLSLETPFATIHAALAVLSAGGAVIVRGGVYLPDEVIEWTVSRTTCSAYGDEVVIFDGSNIPTPDTYNTRVMHVHDCSEVEFNDLRFTEGPDGGVLVDGACDQIDFNRCHFYRNGRASLAEGQGIVLHNDLYGGTDAVTNCTLTDCDAYWNYDVVGGGQNADGFQVSAGAGNSLVRCRSWRNSDDGFDFFNILFETGEIDGVTLDSCWAWENGKDEDGVDTPGDGNGFKLGGQRVGLGNASGSNILIDCMSWRNREIGYTDNECVNPNALLNCIAYDNERINIEGGAGVAHTIRNCIAYQAVESNVSIADNSNVDHNSWDSAVLVTSLDWMSTDDTDAVAGRPVTGRLPESDFLVLRGNGEFASDMLEVGIDVGLPFTGSAPNLGPSFTPGTFVPPAPQPESEIVAAAFTDAPDAFGAYLIDVLVVRLKDAGIWAKLDGLWLMAAPTAADAQINWIDPGTYDLTPVNAPNFLAGVGYAGNGTTSDLDTGAQLDSLAKFQQDDACLFLWSATEDPDTTMQEAGDTSASRVQLRVQSGVESASAYLNSVDYANGANADAPSTIGLFCASRLNATQTTVYVNDSAISTNNTQASSAPPAENLRFGQASGDYSTRRLSAGGVGAGLTASQVQDVLYPAIREYVASVA